MQKGKKFSASKMLIEHRITFQLLLPIFKKNKRNLLLFLMFSVLLGVIPTLKSELESGVLDQAARYLTGIERNDSSVTLNNLIHKPLSRFMSNEPKKDNDLIEDLAKVVFKQATMVWALIIYFGIVIVGYLLAVGSQSLKARFTKAIFVILFSEALRKGIEYDHSSLPSSPNVSGQYATAIQLGAMNFFCTYGNLFEVGQALFSLATVVFLLFSKNYVFALCCLTAVIMQLAISLAQARKLKESRNLWEKKRNELTGITDDVLSKRELLLAHEQQDYYRGKLTDLGKVYINLDQKIAVLATWWSGLSTLVSDYFRILIPVGVLVAGVYFGKSAISTIGDVYFLFSIYGRVMSPAMDILIIYDDMKNSEASSRTFMELLETQLPNQSVDANPPKPRESSDPIIRFENVAFSYKDNSSRILDDCSFSVPLNKTTLVLGRSGSGKSTISKIILGFWPISEGEVLIKGINLRSWNPATLRKLMGYISQGDHIVDETVRENLSWSMPSGDTSDEKITKALEKAKLPSEIINVPAKTLSLGMQQRLSFARLMLDESEIVILDEPFSGVDVFTIKELRDTLAEEFSSYKRTVLMFSHKLVFASFADHIIVLGENGKVVEEGSPRMLLDQKGQFFGIYEAAQSELNIVLPKI